MWFLNDTTGYILCDQGAVFRTTDGSNFQPAGNTCFQTVFDLYCINDSTCFASGSSSGSSCDVSFTTNRGETWTNLTFPYAYAGWGVHALDTSAIWLVGQNQTVIRRGMGGLITSTEFISEKSSETDVRVYPNPSSGEVYLSSETAISAWKLFDISGRLILAGQGNTINLMPVNKGLYCLQIQLSDSRVLSRRLVRE